MIKELLAKSARQFGLDVRDPDDYSFDNILKIALANTRHAPLIFDVGANSGQSVRRFLNIYDSLKIVCFEPQPDEVHRLRTDFGSIEGIKIEQLGLGDKIEARELNVLLKSGTSTFHQYNDTSKYASVKKRVHAVTQVDDLVRKTVEVQVTTLDEYCRCSGVEHIDLLKIDVEGFERFVLSGAQGLLSDGKISMCELELTIDDRFGSRGNFYDIEKYLVPNGFHIIGFDDYYSSVFRKIFHLNVLYAHESILSKVL